MRPDRPYDDTLAPVPARARTRDLSVYEPTVAGEFYSEEIDLRSAWNAIVRQRRTIIAVVSLVTLATLLASLLQRPVYRSSALVEIRSPSTRMVRLDTLEHSGSVRMREYLKTQWRIIRSESVVEAVLARVDLASAPEFADAGSQAHGWASVRRLIAGLAGEAAAGGAVGASPIADGLASRGLIDAFLERLSVEPLSESHLVTVSFDSHDPALAATVANAAVHEYIRLNDERRFQSAFAAKGFLEVEIEGARERLERSERTLNDFAREQNIFDVDEHTALASTRIAELSSELNRVVTERVEAESAFRQSRAGRADLSRTVLDDELIRSLRDKHARLSAEYVSLSKIYKDDYPELLRLRAEIVETRRTIGRESARITGGLELDFERAGRRESLLRAEVEKSKTELSGLKDRAVQHHILKREWETNKEIYVSLLAQLKELGVAAGMGADNIAVIDLGRVPEAPHRPNIAFNLVVSLIGGLALALGVAFLLVYLDDGVRSAEDLEALTGMSGLGLVPKVDASEMHQVYRSEAEGRRPDAVSEALRGVRTNLLFAQGAAPTRVIQVTSATPSEGKTTTSSGLAVSLAQAGFRVLLIDADLRRPRVHEVFGMSRSPGLSESLSDGSRAEPRDAPVLDLSVLTAGAPVADPAELLSGFDPSVWREGEDAYDFVIVDSAPVLGLADPSVVATKVESTLLVVSAESARKGAVSAALKQLRFVRAPLVGAVLNMADPSRSPHAAGAYYAYGNGVDATSP